MLHDRPRLIGWATLGALLLLTALAYARVRRMLRPLDDIRAGARRFGAGDFAQPIPVRQPQRPVYAMDVPNDSVGPTGNGQKQHSTCKTKKD